MSKMETRTSRARETALAIAVLTALAVGLVATGVLPSQADHVPIHIEELTEGSRGVFTDDVSVQIRRKLDGHGTEVLNLSDASHVANMRITVQPGAKFPWHTHPGPVIVTVTEGLLVYVQADDCALRPYASGTSFVDTGNSVHTAYAPSGGEDETVLIATFLDVPEADPLTISESEAVNDELDARCAIDVSTDGSG